MLNNKLSEEFRSACHLAKQSNNRFLTTEFILLHLLRASDNMTRNILSDCGVKTDDLEAQLQDACQAQEKIEGRYSKAELAMSPNLSLVETIADTVVFIRTKGKGKVDETDMLLAILTEPTSTAKMCLVQHGITREVLLAYVVFGIKNRRV